MITEHPLYGTRKEASAIDMLRLHHNGLNFPQCIADYYCYRGCCKTYQGG
jgi:hypothetical protein